MSGRRRGAFLEQIILGRSVVASTTGTGDPARRRSRQCLRIDRPARQGFIGQARGIAARLQDDDTRSACSCDVSQGKPVEPPGGGDSFAFDEHGRLVVGHPRWWRNCPMAGSTPSRSTSIREVSAGASWLECRRRIRVDFEDDWTAADHAALHVGRANRRQDCASVSASSINRLAHGAAAVDARADDDPLARHDRARVLESRSRCRS